MDRYSNKAYEQRLDQSKNESQGRRLTAANFQQDGTRKLYRYSRNMEEDNSRCTFPPVQGDDGRRRGVLTNYVEESGQGMSYARAAQYQALDADRAAQCQTRGADRAALCQAGGAQRAAQYQALAAERAAQCQARGADRAAQCQARGVERAAQYQALAAERRDQYQKNDSWDQPPVTVGQAEKPPHAHQGDWKAERRRRVENAMKRVEQSYVGELRHAHNESIYIRPDLTEHQDARRPAALVPLAHATPALPHPQPPVPDIVDNRRPTTEQIDRSLLIPSSKNKGSGRTPEEEFELDMKRQSLLERKIREANEFHRNQKLNAFKPVKEEPVERSRGVTNNHACRPPFPPGQQKMPVPPIRDDRSNGKYQPMPPSMLKQEDSFSKRRRKLKPYPEIREGANVNVEPPTEETESSIHKAKAKYNVPGAPTALSQAIPHTMKAERHGCSLDVDTKGVGNVEASVSSRDVEGPRGSVVSREGEVTRASLASKSVEITNVTSRSIEGLRASGSSPAITASPTGPKAPLIPRQASYNIWNGDTAKRGLGFKSKLRKEMEEASLRSVEPKEDAGVPKKHTYVAPEVAAKWKRRILYDL